MYSISVTNYKKKLIVLVSILLLWALIIIGTGLVFDRTVKYTVTINSQISFSYPTGFEITNLYAKDSSSAPYLQASNSNYKNFIDFKSSEQDFEFSYPSIFKIEQQSFPGSEILYHIDLQNKQNKKFVGFVQVWNMPYPLDKFLEASKQSSLEDFLDFKSTKINVNNTEGYFWEYTIKSATENYKGLEVFFSKGPKLYRVSYYIPKKQYNKDEYNMFWKMVNSFKIG